MRSVRLGEELEARLEQAAEVAGEPVSELIRDAVRKKCDEVLGATLDVRLKDYIGIYSSKRSARDAKKELAKILEQKHDPAKRRTRRNRR